MNKQNSTIKTNLEDTQSSYNKQDRDDINIFFYKNRIHVPTSLRRRTLDWYHSYLNHTGGDRLAKTLKEFFIGKVSKTKLSIMQSVMSIVNISKIVDHAMDICHQRT